MAYGVVIKAAGC